MKLSNTQREMLFRVIRATLDEGGNPHGSKYATFGERRPIVLPDERKAALAQLERKGLIEWVGLAGMGCWVVTNAGRAAFEAATA